MSDIESPQRKYEGPARIEQADVDQYAVNKNRVLLGKKTQAEKLTETYGPKGIGWGFETTVYVEQNHVDRELHSVEFDLAKQATHNWLAEKEGLSGYRLDDGTSAAGLTATVAPVPRADIVVYPDGDIYVASKQEKENEK